MRCSLKLRGPAAISRRGGSRLEKAAVLAEALGIRVARLRFGMVLGNDGGALAKMLPPFRLGVGGRLGSGRQ